EQGRLRAEAAPAGAGTRPAGRGLALGGAGRPGPGGSAALPVGTGPVHRRADLPGPQDAARGPLGLVAAPARVTEGGLTGRGRDLAGLSVVQPPVRPPAPDRAPLQAETKGRDARRCRAVVFTVSRHGPRDLCERDAGGPLPDDRPAAAGPGTPAVPALGAEAA